MQSRGLTNAHTIVPGMLPSSLPRSSNTAWQVGLAAGLAATANLRPPNPSVGHQAATTAAAARAAAAFQASRAMAKSQQSPLLQQGSGEFSLGLIFSRFSLGLTGEASLGLVGSEG